MNKQEALDAINNEHIAFGLMATAIYSGAKRLNEHPGLWEKKIDDRWLIKCNGHQEDTDNVPALSWYIEYNGWPAGIIGVMGDGILCGGDAANEDSLREALVNYINTTTHA